jgi:hypothetical protein
VVIVEDLIGQVAVVAIIGGCVDTGQVQCHLASVTVGPHEDPAVVLVDTGPLDAVSLQQDRQVGQRDGQHDRLQARPATEPDVRANGDDEQENDAAEHGHAPTGPHRLLHPRPQAAAVVGTLVPAVDRTSRSGGVSRVWVVSEAPSWAGPAEVEGHGPHSRNRRPTARRETWCAVRLPQPAV